MTDTRVRTTADGTAASASSAAGLPPVVEPGLTSDEVRERVESGRTNHVKGSTSRSFADILRANVFTLFNGIILTAMVLVLLTGSWKDAVFGLIIIVNSGIGVLTETRAKHTLDRLSILVAADYAVRRDGRDVTVPHEGIVIDDLLWIRSGDQVPADAVVVRTWGLELDESMLTGESRTVRRRDGESVYSGSTVVSGLALTRVTAVGEHGYAATLTAQAKVYRRTVSDLSRGINTILKCMTVVVVPLCALLVWSQLRAVGGLDVAVATGRWREAVVSAVAGVVGMIPEGLVLLVSLNFAIAAMRLARGNTLVQELESVETLARVDCLNLDKTGTITDGGVTLRGVVPLGGAPADAVSADAVAGDAASDRATPADAVLESRIAALCAEESPNATGTAILEGLARRGVVPASVEARIPFSSARKWSAVRTTDGGWYLGAPEVLLSAIDDDHADVAATVSSLASRGDRVLLVAHAPQAPDPDDPRLDPRAAPIALVVCSESVREDARPTLAWFREQGVRCRIISGDNPATVGAIADRVNLTGDRPARTMDARELPEEIDELSRVLENVDVLGRVLPEQKKVIVQALHARGRVVAMTGDGVNDALALKEADLGIAMGNAAPATKAVAQLVLVDSRFSHLPDVVARGRQVMANMERVASLFLTKTVYSSLIALGVVLSGIPFPYLPRHITYVGALTIGIPAFILALAPNTRRYIPGFLGRVVRFALPGGVVIALSVLLSAWMLPGVMGWDLGRASDLTELRSTCAIILFVLGIAVLGRVARPLRSWRGLLILAFALAGLAGLVIPPVASFFALQLPTERMLGATLAVLAFAAVLFVLGHALAPAVVRLAARLRDGVTGRRRP
ncbi:HAD-IC family P-type ATPase [uncultured Bifidobacterium sp.]|uniref:HAD-IC family P-type ATPase n=1 Tax=uncultured Bifidobacterium sp. TaxID=165187 RepID=UPI0028DB0228|nr:HAD-IC family P-type ATPase [uncultured Bifidobacterium sp.]